MYTIWQHFRHTSKSKSGKFHLCIFVSPGSASTFTCLLKFKDIQIWPPKNWKPFIDFCQYLTLSVKIEWKFFVHPLGYKYLMTSISNWPWNIYPLYLAQKFYGSTFEYKPPKMVHLWLNFSTKFVTTEVKKYKVWWSFAAPKLISAPLTWNHNRRIWFLHH